MNPDFQNLSREERDVRITAFLLGELAPDEAEALRLVIDADPELTRAYEARKHTLELLRETVEGEAGIPAGAPKHLSSERREKLLASFRAAPARKQKRWRSLWFIPMTAAAGLIGLLVVVSIDQGPFKKAKARAQRITMLPAYGAPLAKGGDSDGDAIVTELAAESVRRIENRLADVRDLNRNAAPDESLERGGRPESATAKPTLPQVTTMSGRAATLSLGDKRYAVTDAVINGRPASVRPAGDDREAKRREIKLQQQVVMPSTSPEVATLDPGSFSSVGGLGGAITPLIANPVPANAPPPPVVFPQQSLSFGIEPQVEFKTDPNSKAGELVQLYNAGVVAALVLPLNSTRERKPALAESEKPAAAPMPMQNKMLAGSATPARPQGDLSPTWYVVTDIATPARPQGDGASFGGDSVLPTGRVNGSFLARNDFIAPGQTISPKSFMNVAPADGLADLSFQKARISDGTVDGRVSQVGNPVGGVQNRGDDLSYAFNAPVAGAAASPPPVELNLNGVTTLVTNAVVQNSVWNFQNSDVLVGNGPIGANDFYAIAPTVPQTGGGSQFGRSYFDDSTFGEKGAKAELGFGSRLDSAVRRAAVQADGGAQQLAQADAPRGQLAVRSSDRFGGGGGRGGARTEGIALPGIVAQDEGAIVETKKGLAQNEARGLGSAVDRARIVTGAATERTLGDFDALAAEPEQLAKRVEEQLARKQDYAGVAAADLESRSDPARPAPNFSKRPAAGAGGLPAAQKPASGPEVAARRETVPATRAQSLAQAAPTTNATRFYRLPRLNDPQSSVTHGGETAIAPRPAAPAPVPQPEVLTRDNAFSTFSLNVADVSFKLAAASLEKGAMPEAANIRAEEFLNAFDYRDPVPPSGSAVAFAWERSQFPFAQNRDALRFSVKTAAAGRDGGRPLNIVLLLDSSGSMERADRVRIIQEGLRTLATQLQAQDKISVVTFARMARLWVDGVSGTNAAEVARRVGEITPEGGTNLEDALDLAYRTAARHYAANAINRVVLLTDGAANLGDVEPANLKAKVETNRKQGIALDCFGVGWEGFNDDLLEQLSRNGDGRYGFINSPEEAATEFAGQLAGALRVAASDVKVQVEFNPKRVNAYRQIGYAKHQLTKEQFRDNKVDAAEIGASEAGNGLYVIETNPRGEGPVATVRVRYRIPNTSDYREQEWVVPFTLAVPIEQSSAQMKLAVTSAAFAESLASSPFAAEVTSDRLLQIFAGVPDTFGADPRPKKLEWMLRQAKAISGR